MRSPTLRGRIAHRLLVNTLVDPSEAARHLPPGVRPHEIDGGTVAGCCMLDIDEIRPVGLPVAAGRSIRAVAHRLSAEWEVDGETVVGVHVPMRYTDSRLAAALGGRFFPGAHRMADLASLTLDDSSERVAWSVHGQDVSADFAGSIAGDEPAGECETMIAATCVGATAGLSPRRRAGFDQVAMYPDSCAVTRVVLDEAWSSFLDSFASRGDVTAVLMRDVQVRWEGTGPRATAAA